jgi:hypothetical protein
LYFYSQLVFGIKSMDIFDGILRSLIAATLLLLAIYVWFFESRRSEYEDRLELEDEMQEPAKPAVSPSKKAHIMRRLNETDPKPKPKPKPKQSQQATPFAQASAPSKNSHHQKSQGEEPRRRFRDDIKSVFSKKCAPSLNIDQNNNVGQSEPPSSHRRHRHSAIRTLAPSTHFGNKPAPS